MWSSMSDVLSFPDDLRLLFADLQTGSPVPYEALRSDPGVRCIHVALEARCRHLLADLRVPNYSGTTKPDFALMLVANSKVAFDVSLHFL